MRMIARNAALALSLSAVAAAMAWPRGSPDADVDMFRARLALFGAGALFLGVFHGFWRPTVSRWNGRIPVSRFGHHCWTLAIGHTGLALLAVATGLAPQAWAFWLGMPAFLAVLIGRAHDRQRDPRRRARGVGRTAPTIRGRVTI